MEIEMKNLIIVIVLVVAFFQTQIAQATKFEECSFGTQYQQLVAPYMWREISNFVVTETNIRITVGTTTVHGPIKKGKVCSAFVNMINTALSQINTEFSEDEKTLFINWLQANPDLEIYWAPQADESVWNELPIQASDYRFVAETSTYEIWTNPNSWVELEHSFLASVQKSSLPVELPVWGYTEVSDTYSIVYCDSGGMIFNITNVEGTELILISKGSIFENPCPEELQGLYLVDYQKVEEYGETVIVHSVRLKGEVIIH